MSENDADEAAERVDEQIDEAQGVYQRQSRIVRGVWIAGGVLVLLVGGVLFAVPGSPATVVIAAGLAMLSVVSEWARRLLTGSVRKSVEAKDILEDIDRKAKALGVAALASLGAALLAATLALVVR